MILACSVHSLHRSVQVVNGNSRVGSDSASMLCWILESRQKVFLFDSQPNRCCVCDSDYCLVILASICFSIKHATVQRGTWWKADAEMREFPQARGDPCRVPVSLLSLSFALRCVFSLWRVVADVQVAPGVPQMFVEPTNLADFGHFDNRVRKLQRRISPPWFRPGPCPEPKRVSAHWNMVRHVLRMVTVKLRHASWLGNDCSAEKMDYPVFSNHELNLYTTSDAIAQSILLSSNEGDRAASWTHTTDAWLLHHGTSDPFPLGAATTVTAMWTGPWPNSVGFVNFQSTVAISLDVIGT